MADLHEDIVAADAPELLAALIAAHLPIDDLLDDGRSFYRFDHAGETVAFGGLELYGENALLRSVVVLPDHQGQGFGRAATDRLLHHVFNAGAHHAYLLTISAACFFEALGFERIERAAAPADILKTRQASAICSSAALLARPIAGQNG